MQSVLLPIQWTLEMERSLISSQIKQPVWAIGRYVHSRSTHRIILCCEYFNIEKFEIVFEWKTLLFLPSFQHNVKN